MGEVVENVTSYVDLGVIFEEPKFEITNEAEDRLTKGYASLDAFERKCAQCSFNNLGQGFDYSINWLHLHYFMVTPIELFISRDRGEVNTRNLIAHFKLMILSMMMKRSTIVLTDRFDVSPDLE